MVAEGTSLDISATQNRDPRQQVSPWLQLDALSTVSNERQAAHALTSPPLPSPSPVLSYSPWTIILSHDPPPSLLLVHTARYDLLCIEGLALALRIFLNLQSPPTYTLSSLPEDQLQVVHISPDVAQIRPFFSGAVLRLKRALNAAEEKSFLDLQDKLHSNLCRNRKFVAIGTHDLDTIKGPFRYVVQLTVGCWLVASGGAWEQRRIGNWRSKDGGDERTRRLPRFAKHLLLAVENLEREEKDLD
jgi:hypothetical protein